MEGRPSIDTEENCYLRVPGSPCPSRRTASVADEKRSIAVPEPHDLSVRDERSRVASQQIYIAKLINGGEFHTSREVRLSRRDETLVDLLIETGLSRNIAKTLVFLSKGDETTSAEIEKATGLRHPEVSPV